MHRHRVFVSLLLVGTLAACAAPSPPASPRPEPRLQLGVLSAAATGTDKGRSQHIATEPDARVLFQWKDGRIRHFEIGTAEGGSLAMRQSYFPKARIFAADTLDKPQFNNARVTTLVADQANRDQLQAA